MRKRILGLGIIAAAIMLVSIAGTASAQWVVTKSATVRGHTGSISIKTFDVQVSTTFQPGDTQYAWLKVRNTSGRCPIEITNVVAKGYPSWLIVTVKRGDYNERLLPNQFGYFLIWLKMKGTATGHKGEFFSFQIEFTARNCSTHFDTVGSDGS